MNYTQKTEYEYIIFVKKLTNSVDSAKTLLDLMEFSNFDDYLMDSIQDHCVIAPIHIMQAEGSYSTKVELLTNAYLRSMGLSDLTRYYESGYQGLNEHLDISNHLLLLGNVIHRIADDDVESFKEEWWITCINGLTNIISDISNHLDSAKQDDLVPLMLMYYILDHVNIGQNHELFDSLECITKYIYGINSNTILLIADMMEAKSDYNFWKNYNTSNFKVENIDLPTL